MRKFLFLLLIPVFAFADDQDYGTHLERVYSQPTTNRAWRRDYVMVRNGELDDPTGTLASKADVEFLMAVEGGISEIHQAGTNGFNRAKGEFLAAVSNHPPQNATQIAMSFPPYSTLRPTDRNMYGYLASETNHIGTTNICHWFFSRPFLLKPRLIAQDIYLDTSGNVKTNYTDCSFPDYYNDATNNPARVDGEWDRIIRSFDPPSPVANATIRRMHHMKFGHPENGFTPGSLNIDVKTNSTATAAHAVTGTYTDTVNRVYYEFTRGACTKHGSY